MRVVKEEQQKHRGHRVVLGHKGTTGSLGGKIKLHCKHPLTACLQRQLPERDYINKKYKQYKKSSSRDEFITNYEKLDML